MIEPEVARSTAANNTLSIHGNLQIKDRYPLSIDELEAFPRCVAMYALAEV